MIIATNAPTSACISINLLLSSFSSPIYMYISHFTPMYNSWPLLSHTTIPAQHRVHLTEICYYQAPQLMELQPLKCFPNCFLLHYFANLIHNSLHVEWYYVQKGCSSIDCCIYTCKCKVKNASFNKCSYEYLCMYPVTKN